MWLPLNRPTCSGCIIEGGLPHEGDYNRQLHCAHKNLFLDIYTCTGKICFLAYMYTSYTALIF